MNAKQLLAYALVLGALFLLPWALQAGYKAHHAGANNASSAVPADLQQEVRAASRHRDRLDAMNLQQRGSAPKADNASLAYDDSTHTGKLLVKFRDAVRARVRPAAPASIVSASGDELNDFRQIIDRNRLSVQRAITSVSEEKLAEFELEAAERSGRQQPDLAGMIYVTGNPQQLNRAARALNDLPTIEYVEFERQFADDGAHKSKQAEAQPINPGATGNRLAQAARRPAPAVRTRNTKNWDDTVILKRPEKGADSQKVAAVGRDTLDAPLRRFDVEADLDTGPLLHSDPDVPRAGDGEAEVVFSEEVGVDDATWLRLRFDQVELSGNPMRGIGSYLRITSLKDGAVQYHDAITMRQWENTTAYFNGDRVRVELFSFPNTGVNRLVLDQITAGERGGFVAGDGQGGGALNVCPGVPDERTSSNDPKDARLMPGGCTGFLFNDNDYCMLAAGHCASPQANLQVAQFNVPQSEPDGTPVHPGPEDQYFVDSVSIQSQFEPADPNSCGNDWAYFGVFPNANTGSTPFAAQGDSYTLAGAAPTPSGQELLVRGYGVDEKPPGSTGGFNEDSQTQQVDTGPFLDSNGTSLFYHLSAGPGNSGSATLDVDNDEVIGILTCGTCQVPNPPTVISTAIDHPQLQAALNNPQGICDDTPGACCFGPNGDDDCEDNYTYADCRNEGGWFAGPDTNCEDDDPCEEPECGDDIANGCFDYMNPNAACNNEDCCEAVCEIDPYCCNDLDASPDPTRPLPGRWDAHCVELAMSLGECGGGDSFCGALEGDPTRPCFESHSLPGCNLQECCERVANFEPECLEIAWTDECVELAHLLCTDSDSDDISPDLSFYQGYATPRSYWQESHLDPDIEDGQVPEEIVGAVPGNPITGLPLSGYTGEGYDLETLWEFGDLLEGENQTRGQGIRIGVLYPTAFIDPVNEDLFHEDLAGRVTYPETDQTMILNPKSPIEMLNGHAGTAILGILTADPDNDIGMQGISPDSDVYFFPTVSKEEGGRFQNAVASALDIFDAGDVVLAPQMVRGPAGSHMASTTTGWLMLRIASDLGILSVIPAGDDCAQLQEQAGAGDLVDSNAIIVGGVTPGFPYRRWGLSNFCEEDGICDPEVAVHIGGWAQAVATLGYGDLYLPADDDGEADLLRAYTMRFSGTRAAAAMVAGIAANLQGLSKQFYGIPLAPVQLRGEIASNAFFQNGTPQPPGSPVPFPCSGDFDPDEPSNRISSVTWPDPFSPGDVLVANGGLTDLPLAAEWVVAGGFFDDCDELDQIDVVRGEHASGNLFAVCQDDSIFYVGESQWTEAGSSPNADVVPDAPLGSAAYVATGQVVDFLVQANAPTTSPLVNFDVTVTAGPVEPAGFTVIELYNFDIGQWNLIDIGFHGAGGSPALVSRPFTAGPYVRDSDARVYVRVWGYALPGGSSPGGSPQTDPFEYPLDNVSLDFAGGGFDPGGEE